MICNFNLDELDFFIIKKIYECKGKDVTTWQMAKEYYKFEERNGDREYDRKRAKLITTKCGSISSRLNKMEKYGFVIIERVPNGKRPDVIYNLIKENVYIGNQKFKRKNFNTIQLKIKDRWCSFQTIN